MESDQSTSQAFKKFDAGKLRLSLLPIRALIETTQILEYGAKKYAPNNWKKVEDLDRYYDALLRHLLDWKLGNKHDQESGYKHLAHVACNALFLLELDGNQEETKVHIGPENQRDKDST